MNRIKNICLTFALGCISISTNAQNTFSVFDKNMGEEEVIEIPENMTADIDSLLSQWYSRTYLDKEEECHMKEENPFFPQDTYIDRLQRLPSIIEMPYNPIIQKFIDMYSGRLRRSVSYMLAAGNFYMPIFEEALDTYGIPQELKYLPIIESALNPKATSRVGAAGLWQFMLGTGKMYDLQVNSLIDERRDPIKSTFAAARYLKDLYNIYHDWNLVIAAYNCGPGNINKAIHRANEEKDYWKIYNYLPQETRGYVPAFIAANYIMNYYCDHNICPMESRLPAQTDTLQVNKDLYMEQVSELCNISISELQALNPQYKTHLIPGNSGLCTLRLPSTIVGNFISQQDTIYNHRLDELQNKRRVVEVETPTYSVSKKSSRSSRSSRNQGGKKHKIRNGETLSEIAHKNGTTVAKLRRLNGISGSSIRAGQTIRVK